MEQPLRKYLAHVQLRPQDGSPPVVVESEFQATSYPTAWEHVLGMGRKFDATIMSHKLVEIDNDGVINGDSTVLTVADANAAEMPKPTLTVKAEVKQTGWYGMAIRDMPAALPFPYNEETADDSVAI